MKQLTIAFHWAYLFTENVGNANLFSKFAICFLSCKKSSQQNGIERARFAVKAEIKGVAFFASQISVMKISCVTKMITTSCSPMILCAVF